MKSLLKSIKILFMAFLVVFSVKIGFAQNVSIHALINSLIASYGKGIKTFANKDIDALYRKQGFKWYLEAYPVTGLSGEYEWSLGMGSEFIGPLSKLPIKAPFSDYLPLSKGPILNPDKTYR
ncbi:MAG: hypothetical protein H8E36_15600, partial [Rhodospirillaceae bacterium]|nr:hypothetical protein [Rhodospirillaceae bacterium]